MCGRVVWVVAQEGRAQMTDGGIKIGEVALSARELNL